MNQFEISKDSLISLVRLTIDADHDVRLHNRTWLKWIHNTPLKIAFISKGKVSVSAQVETRFGQDMVKVIDKMAETIRKNLEGQAKIKVHRIRLNVKDVFNEVADHKNS